MKTLLAAAAAAALLVSPVSVFAQVNPGGAGEGATNAPNTTVGPGGRGTLSQKDRRFLQRDARGNAYEIELSKLALERATNPQIKQFAQQDIEDHNLLIEQQKHIAQQDGINLANTPTKAQEKRIQHLQSLNGQQFDKTYIQYEKQTNRGDMQRLDAEMKSTQNPQVKDYAERAQATEQKHQEAIQKL